MKIQEVLKHCVLVSVMFGLPVSVQAQEAVPLMDVMLAQQENLEPQGKFGEIISSLQKEIVSLKEEIASLKAKVASFEKSEKIASLKAEIAALEKSEKGSETVTSPENSEANTDLKEEIASLRTEIVSPENSEANITSCSHLYFRTGRDRFQGKEARQRAYAGILHFSFEACKEKGFNTYEILSEKNYPRKHNVYKYHESQCYDAKINCFRKVGKSASFLGICTHKIDRREENYYKEDYMLDKEIEDFGKTACNKINFNSYNISLRRPYVRYLPNDSDEDDRLCAAIHLQCFNK